MRRRFIVRAVIIFLSFILLGEIIIYFFPSLVLLSLSVLFNTSIATPPPPKITVPCGSLPTGVVGLQEWAQEPNAAYTPISASGFLLGLNSQETVGVTTAHSLFQNNPHRRLTRIGLGINGQAFPLAEADAYFGYPGAPESNNDLAIDYILLKTKMVNEAYALSADPRGQPQPGERVVLFSGLGDRHGGAFSWTGTVLSVDPTAVFIEMDLKNLLTPSGMSGSPVVSQCTGKVVGMVIAAGWQGNRWIIGLNPIGHIVQIAKDANVFPRMVDYQR